MSREKTFTAITIKRQDYSETDQIATLFTREAGKIRAIVKSAKSPTSKLQGSLQPMFLSAVTVVRSSGIGQVIHASVIDSALGVYTDSNKLSTWFVVAEMLIKTLPDEEPNEMLFDITQQYLSFLDSCQPVSPQLELLTIQYQIKALRSLGLGMQFPSREELEHYSQLAFDASEGGFITKGERLNVVQVSSLLVQLLEVLDREPFQLFQIADADLVTVRKMINTFVTYQLDRELKSTR